MLSLDNLSGERRDVACAPCANMAALGDASLVDVDRRTHGVPEQHGRPDGAGDRRRLPWCRSPPRSVSTTHGRCAPSRTRSGWSSGMGDADASARRGRVCRSSTTSCRGRSLKLRVLNALHTAAAHYGLLPRARHHRPRRRRSGRPSAPRPRRRGDRRGARRTARRRRQRVHRDDVRALRQFRPRPPVRRRSPPTRARSSRRACRPPFGRGSHGTCRSMRSPTCWRCGRGRRSASTTRVQPRVVADPLATDVRANRGRLHDRRPRRPTGGSPRHCSASKRSSVTSPATLPWPIR